MSHSIHRVHRVEVVGPHALRVEFDDGTSQTIDLEPVLAGALYGPLRDPAVFRQVRIDPEVYTLVWPNGADFDPATLHDWPTYREAFGVAQGSGRPRGPRGMGTSKVRGDKSGRQVVGVISDTHGLIRPEAVERLRGSDLIVHCGDIGAPAVLDALRAVAPVRAVRGNNDKGPWAIELPTDDVIEVGTHILYVIHDLGELGLEPAAAGFTAVLSGHSHRPFVEERKGVRFVNPGSAGPRRFSLPVAVAKLVLASGRCDAHIIELPA